MKKTQPVQPRHTIKQKRPSPTVKTGARLIRLPEVKARVGLSRSTIYARIKSNEFPAPVRLGSNARSVAWLESSIDDFINALLVGSQKGVNI
jgi:prophage regulatory protein